MRIIGAFPPSVVWHFDEGEEMDIREMQRQINEMCDYQMSIEGLEKTRKFFQHLKAEIAEIGDN